MRDHRTLRAFDLADEIALMTYKITKQFPREEIYGLVSQMRRAAVSVPSNIVEGCSRESRVEYLRFLEIAFGSLRELNYQASLATRFNYLGSPEVELYPEKIEEAEKVLSALIRAVRHPEPLPP